ncbi:MAG: M20 family metallopeptidase [Meiothermus sp.]|nr:M20 family metallopeptidase [Meiothermus sp.]
MNPLAHLQAQLPAVLQDLEAITRLEAPSHDLEGLSKVADWISEKFSPFGAVRREETVNGPMLGLSLAGSGKKVLALCHFDTVHPVGAFDVPWKLEGDRAYGPGIYDMKGNIVQLLWALRTGHELGMGVPNLELLFTPDEEVGSPASRDAIEAAARRSEVVLVLEAPMGNGDLKVARKGVGQYKLTALGQAAHQGVEPEKGRNAIVELAHQIPRVVALQDLEKGTTLGPNVVRGGTTSNVVPDRATVDIDLRAWTQAESERIHAAMHALKPVLEGTSLVVEGGMNRPPMEPTPASMQLFEMARRIGAEVGLQLGPGRVGGGSDGNLTAALGIPTLDGLGLYGAAAHQLTENIFVPQVPNRIAMIAGILAELAR